MCAQGTSLLVQWLRFCASNAADLIPGQETKISQVTQHDIYIYINEYKSVPREQVQSKFLIHG